MLRALSQLPLWLVIYVPLALWAGQLILDIITPAHEKAVLYTEGGPHETLQAIFLLCAIPVAFLLLIRAIKTGAPIWMKIWFGLALLGCVYVCGEEVSWGQWIFRWDTPEHWAAINDQRETNLHNTSAWLDQKPRLLLEIGIIVGGLLLPFLRWKRPSILPQKFAAIYPPDQLVFVAFMAEFTKWGDAFFKNVMHQPLFERASEVQELYFFLFVLLYLTYLYASDKSQPSHQS